MLTNAQSKKRPALLRYRPRALTLLGLATAIAFLIAACGGGSTSTTTPSPKAPSAISTPPITSTPPPDEGPTIPASVAANLPTDFRVSMYQGADSVGGSEFLFSSLFTQGKPVVLNFWAGLCPPCRAEMPDIQDVADQFGDQIVILGLDIGPFVGLGSRDDGRALLRELGVTYPAGTTFESKVVRDYGILGMPTTVFLSPDGKVFRKWTGLITKGKMTEIIQQVLQSSSS